MILPKSFAWWCLILFLQKPRKDINYWEWVCTKISWTLVKTIDNINYSIWFVCFDILYQYIRELYTKKTSYQMKIDRVLLVFPINFTQSGLSRNLILHKKIIWVFHKICIWLWKIMWVLLARDGHIPLHQSLNLKVCYELLWNKSYQRLYFST